MDRLDQRVADRECREATEIAIVGPQFTHAVRKTECSDARIVDLRPGGPARGQAIREHGPVRVVLRQRDERRRLEPRADLIESVRQRRRRPVVARMRHDCEKFVDARPGNRPGAPSFGESRDGIARHRVPGRVPPMRVHEQVRVDGDHEPRSR